jgi:hypothetical protein
VTSAASQTATQTDTSSKHGHVKSKAAPNGTLGLPWKSLQLTNDLGQHMHDTKQSPHGQRPQDQSVESMHQSGALPDTDSASEFGSEYSIEYTSDSEHDDTAGGPLHNDQTPSRLRAEGSAQSRSQTGASAMDSSDMSEVSGSMCASFVIAPSTLHSYSRSWYKDGNVAICLSSSALATLAAELAR